MNFKYFFVSFIIILASLQTSQAEVSPKTNKYLSILLKRPSSDYLFDKFYSAWLEEASGTDLEKFLDSKFTETKNPVYRQLKAYYFEIEGNNDLALDIYNEVISTNSSASLLFKRGALEVHTLEFEKAITDLKAALKQSPSEKLAIQINKLLGKIYIRDERKEEGLKVWLEMANTFNDEELKEEVIELMVDEGLFAEANKQISELISKTTNKHKKVTLTLRLGDIFRIQGNKQDALKKYSETLDSIGTGSWLEKEVLSQIDQVFRSEDNLQGLADYYAKIILEKKNNIEILKRQAALLYELGQTEKSLAAHLEIVKLTPLEKENKEAYAGQLTKSKKYSDALGIIHALIKQYPHDQELYISSARLNKLLKKDNACEKDLLTYITKDKASEYSYMRAANLLRSFKLKSKAALIYDQLVKKFPDSREARLLRALNLYQIDKKEDAIKEYKALGKTKNINEIQRLVVTLNTLKEPQVSFDILKQQQESFKKSFIFNELLYSAAANIKNDKLVTTSAQAMLDSAKTIKEIAKAASNIIYTAKKTEKFNPLLEGLENKKIKTLNESILLSEIYDNMDEIDSALEVIAKEISKAPKNPIFLEQKLRLCKKNREWELAIATLTELTQMSSKKKTANMKELVDLSLRADQKEKAFEWIAEWKKASVSSTSPYIHEAAIYRDDLSYLKAAEVLKKAMYKFPDNQTLPRLLAQDYNFAGKYTEATNIYWRLIGKTEDLSEKLGLMRSIIQLAQQEDGIEELAQKLQGRMKHNPKSVFPPLALAELSRHSGSYENRRKYLIKATELKSNDLNLLAEISRIEEEEGQYDRALDTLKKLKALDKSKKFANLLPQFFMRSGEEDRAFEHIIENSGGINMPVDDVIKTTITLINSHSQRTESFIKPYLLKFPEDYRIQFLHAISLEENSLSVEAADAFINALKCTKEVSIAQKTPTQQSPFSQNSSRYYKQLEKFMPTEAIDLMLSGNMMHQVYTYKNNNQNFGGMSFGNNRQQFPLPKKLSDLEKYIIPHLSFIKDSLDEKQQENLVQKLEQAGVSYAELKLKISNRRYAQQGQTDFWKKLYKKYKEDKTFTSLYAYMMSMQIQTAEELNELFPLTKEIHTQLTVNLIATALHKKIEVKKEYITFLVESINKATYKDVQSTIVARLLASDSFPKEHIPSLKEKMLQLYNDDPNKGQNWGPYQIMMTLIKLDDYKEFIKIINQEVESHQVNPKKSPYNYGHYGYNNYGQQQKLIIPLQFPPLNSKKLPPFVSQLFSQRNGYNQGKGIDKELLSKEIESIKSPLLKLLIADYCEQEAITSTVIKSFSEIKKKSLENNLILAGWYGMNEKYKEAVTLLSVTRKLCAKKSEMKKVNASIVYYVESSEDKNLREQAKKAAEKLIALRLTLKGKGELASFLEDLGYTTMANNLDKEIDKAANRKTPIVSSNSNFGNRRAPDPSEKVRLLFSQGKNKEAVALAAREFRKMAKAELNINQRNMNNNSWTIRNLLRQIKEKKKDEEFTALLKPTGEDTYSRKLLERALAYEFLKENEKAIKDYQDVLAKNNTSKIAHLRLAFLLASEDLPAAKKHLQNVTGSNINFVGPIISSILSSMYNSINIYDIYPIITEMLKDVKPQVNQQFSWLTNILQQMENNFHSNNVQLPSLFDAKQTIGRSKNKELAETLLKKRNDTYIEMSKIALRFPTTAAIAFGKLEYLISMGRLKSENSFDLAKQALKTNSKNNYFSSHTSSFYANNMQVQTKSPEQVYVQVLLTKKLVEQEADFIKELKGLGVRIKSKLEKVKPLYECNEEQFLETVTTFIEKNKGNLQLKPYSLVIEAYNSRNFKVSLTKIILAKFKTDLKTIQNYGNHISYLAPWTKTLIKKDTKELSNFFDQAFVIIAEKVKDVKKKSKNAQNTPQSYILSSAVQNLFSPCLNSSFKVTTILLDSIAKAGLTDETTLFRNSNITYSLQRLFRERDDLYEELKNTLLFEELSTFSPIPLPSSNDQTSVLKEFTSNIKNNSTTKKKYIAKLKAEGKQTFGVKFLANLLTSDSAQPVYKFLDSYLEEFKKLPPAKQSLFFDSITQIMTKQYQFKRTFQLVKGPFRTLQKSLNKSSSGDKIANFLKEDIANDQYRYTQKAASIISETLEDDLAKAQEIFTAVLKKLKKNHLRNPAAHSNSESPSEALFNRVRNESSNSINKLKLLQAILPTIKFKRQNNFNFNENITQIFNDLLNTSRNLHRSNTKTKDEANFLALKDFLQGDTTKSFNVSLGAALSSSISRCTDKELDQLTQFLNQQKEKSTELIHLTTLFKSRKKNSQAPAPKELLDYYNKQLADESLSINNRLQIMNKSLLEILLRSTNSKETNAILYKVCKLGSLIKNNTQSPYSLNSLMESLFRVPNKDDEWKKAAKSLVITVKKAYKTQPDYYRCHPNSYNSGTLSFIAILCQIGEVQEAKNIIKNTNIRLQQRFETYLILIDNNETEYALNLLRNNIQLIDDPRSSWRDIQKLTDETKRQAAFKLLTNKDNSYAAQAYSTLTLRQKDNSIALAKKFKTEGPKDKNLRKRILQAFNNNSYTKPITKAFNSELFSSIDPMEAIYTRNTNTIQSYTNFLLAKLDSTNQADLEKALEKVKKAHQDNEYDYYAEKMAYYMSKSLYEVLNSNKMNAQYYKKNSAKHILLGKKLLPLADEADDARTLFAMTYMLIEQAQGKEELAKWLNTFSKEYLTGMSAYYFNKTLPLLGKIYVDEQGKTIKSKVSAVKLNYVSSDQLTKIFTSEKTLAEIRKLISTSMTKNVKSLKDLKGISKSVIPQLIKSNPGTMLWKNMEMTYNAFKKDKKKPFEAFKATISMAKEIIPDVHSIGGQSTYNFVGVLSINDYKKYNDYLSTLENQTDWLKELTHVINFHQAYKKKGSKLPEGYIDFYKSYFTNDKISANEKTLIFRNNTSLLEYCPELIPVMAKALAESTISDHDKGHALNILLYISSRVKLSNNNKKDLETLVKFHETLPTSNCTEDGNSFMAFSLKRKLGSKDKIGEDSLKFCETYLQLLYEGDFKTFKELLSQSWQKIDTDKTVTNTFHRTKSRDKLVKPVFESFEDPALKVFAMALYYSTPLSTPKKFTYIDFHNRKTNSPDLNNTAKLFKTVKFEDQKLKNKTMLLFTKSQDSANIIKSEISELFTKMPLEDILVKKSTVFTRSYIAYIKQNILSKNLQVPAVKIAGILEIKQKNSKLKSSAENMAKEIGTMFHQVLTSSFAKGLAIEELKLYQDMLGQILKTVRYDYYAAPVIQALCARLVLEGAEEDAMKVSNMISDKNKGRVSYRDLERILKALPSSYKLKEGQDLNKSKLSILNSKAFINLYKSRKKDLQKILKKIPQATKKEPATN